MPSPLPPSGEALQAAERRFNEQRSARLLSAAAAGDAPYVAQLLRRGCPPDAADYDRRTGLMLAASEGKEVGGGLTVCGHIKLKK